MVKANFWSIYGLGGMEADFLKEILMIFIASFLSGAIGSMGLGGGSVLILYLTLFTGVKQLAAQGINLIFFVPIALLSVIIYALQRKIEYKVILPFILGGVPATLLAGYLVNFIKTDLLSKIFGGLVLVFGVWQIFKKERAENS